jgi:hypothetical protein
MQKLRYVNERENGALVGLFKSIIWCEMILAFAMLISMFISLPKDGMALRNQVHRSESISPVPLFYTRVRDSYKYLTNYDHQLLVLVLIPKFFVL